MDHVSEAGYSYLRRHPEQTDLHRVYTRHLQSFLEEAQSGSLRGLPRFVERELRAFVDCGVLAKGFLRVRCDACRTSRVVAFSCGGRTVCPSCGARRMAEQSAHLASAVLPDVPLRQFVLTVPWPLRQRLAVDPALVKTVLAILVDCIFRFLAEKTGAPGGAKGGAVTVIQRFGGTLNLHVHYHVLVTDGLYEDAKPDEDDAPLVFHPLTARVTEDDERAVAEHIHRRMVRLFRRRGWSDEHGAITWPESEEHPESSAVGLLGTGSDALFEGGSGDREPRLKRHESRGAYGGFSIHAQVTAPAGDGVRRERLCRYLTRPAFASEQVTLMPDGRVRFELRRKRASGETHLVFEPLAFLRRLAGLIRSPGRRECRERPGWPERPPPRVHLLWYHGVFAPASKLRARVVPERSIEDLGLHHPPELEQGELAPKRGTVPCRARTSKRTWAQLLSRVYGIDALPCDDCGARMRVIAAVQKASEVRRILEHLGLPHEVPTLMPARGPPELELWPAA